MFVQKNIAADLRVARIEQERDRILALSRCPNCRSTRFAEEEVICEDGPGPQSRSLHEPGAHGGGPNRAALKRHLQLEHADFVEELVRDRTWSFSTTQELAAAHEELHEEADGE